MKIASELQVRRANIEDATAIASVLQFAFAEYEPLYTKEGYAATTPPVSAVLSRLREGPVWVAVTETRIVGTASAVEKEKALYLRGMGVLPEARGMGVARLLLKEMEGWAGTLGASRLFLSTTPFLDRAIRLYLAFGFRRTQEGPHELFGTPLFTMEKPLNNSEPRARECQPESL
ncbi:MAG TPA: GNAT family N-acetyltransferase [Verrucomicrobiae bacterium]|jgi:GNAT superfamily N-acetyltransferase|nr:GNAT family N-acetyltransferase [Verrucomicrobiae bacterium]